MEQIILDLWQQMFSNDVQQMNEASAKMNEIFKSSDSILAFLNIANTVPDAKIKGYSIVYIYSLIKTHRDALTQNRDVFTTISQNVINLLQSEVSVNSKMILCDLLVENMMFFQNLSYNDHLNIAIQLLQSQDPNSIPIGIYFISRLIDGQHIELYPIEILKLIINTCAQYVQEPLDLNASSFDLFRISYNFFDNVIGIIGNSDELLESFGIITQYLQNTFPRIYGPSGIRCEGDTDQEAQEKVSKYFNLVGSLASEQPNYFATLFTPMIPQINVNLINRNFDINTRNSSISVLESVAMSLPDLIYNDFLSYVVNTSIFAIELFQFNEELQSIYAPQDIYKNICLNLIEEIEPFEILEKFIPAIDALNSMNDPNSLIAVFMILDSIQSFCIDAIIESFDSIQQFIVKAISTGNPIVLEMVSKFIGNLSKENSSIACNLLFTCEQSLLNFVQFDFVVDALRDIYDESSKNPIDSSLSLNCLMNQLTSSPTQYHIERVIECISYLILTIDLILPEYFNQLRPFLIQLLQSNDISCIKCSIFCFSTFAVKFAALVKDDLPQLVQAIINGIPEKDMQFDHICSTIIINFVDIYPQSFAQFCPQILTSLISIINDQDMYENIKNVQRAFEDDQNDNEAQENHRKLSLYSDMRNEAFNAIATIFGTYANELAAQSDEIINIIKKSIEDEDEDELLLGLSGFFASVAEMVPGLIKINKNPDQLIQLYFKARTKMDLYENDLDCCVKFWTSLKVMASKCGPSFLAKYGNDILSIINEIFTDRNFRDIHSQTKKQKFILRKEFIVPITTLVFRLFHDFGGNGWLSSSEDMSATLLQLAPKGIELMNNLIKTTKAAQAQASSAIANIIISCNNNPQFDELAAHILKIVFPHLINSKSGETREYSYDTISTLLYTGHNQALSMLNNNDYIQALLKSTQEVIENNGKYQESLVLSAVVLWCGVVMTFNVQVTQEIFELVISFLPPVPYSPHLEYVAQFAVYATGRWPEVFDAGCMFRVGLSIFASNDEFIRNVKLEYMKLFSDILKSIPHEEIAKELNSDEHSIISVQTHIQHVDSHFT